MRRGIAAITLFVEKDLDGQPSITADLEPVRDTAELLHLFWGQLKVVELEVGFDPRLGD